MHSTDPYAEPLAHDPEGDRFYRERTRAIVDFVLDTWRGQKPAAIVLAGSLALGEGRVLRSGDAIEPASDLDLYVVVEESAFRSAERELVRVRADLADTSEGRGLTIDLGLTTRDRLAKAAPSIAHRTLAAHGRVLAGDPALLEAMRDLREAAPPAADGRLLLMNRTMEALLPVPSFDDASGQGAFWYLHAKTVRDIGLAAIVVAGRFAPRLADRAALVRETWERTELGRLLPGFPDRYEKAADQRFVSDASSRAEGGDALRRAWRELGTDLHAVARFAYAGDDPVRMAALDTPRFRRRVRVWLPFATREPAAFVRAVADGLTRTPLTGACVAALHLARCVGAAWGERTAETEVALGHARRVSPFSATSREPGAEWWDTRNAVCEYWNETVLGGGRTVERGRPQ